jgi:hypothetical protein
MNPSVTVCTGPLAREAIRLSGVRVDVEHTGMLMTSNDRLNEVMRIGRGSFLGNLAFGFPSDCPVSSDPLLWADASSDSLVWADTRKTRVARLRARGGSMGNDAI